MDTTTFLPAARDDAAREKDATARNRTARPASTGLALAALALAAVGAFGGGAAQAQDSPRPIGSPDGGRLDGGRFDAELDALYASTGLNPFDAVGANNLAMKLVARGDYEKAQKLLARAERLDPTRLEIARNAEQVQRLIDQRAELPRRSRAHFRDSFAAAEVPFVAPAWVISGPGEIGAPERAPGDASLAAARADGAAEAADVDETLADNPFDTRWLRRRAAIKTRRGEHRAALDDLRRALVLDPYLSGVAREIERLTALLPENGERPMGIALPVTGSRVLPGRGDAGEVTLPAPWSVPEAESDVGPDVGAGAPGAPGSPSDERERRR